MASTADALEDLAREFARLSSALEERSRQWAATQTDVKEAQRWTRRTIVFLIVVICMFAGLKVLEMSRFIP